ncbi:MAG: lipase family protein [Candidatus Acidiferrales bacterium]
MSTQYDPQLSILLASLSEQTYVQYRNGPPPGNNGKIDVPTGYTQIASFVAPEVTPSSKLNQLSDIAWGDIRGSAELRARFAGIADVYFGFALTSPSQNIIALRGTQSDFEWALDSAIPQVPVPLVWYSHGKFQQARVHLGFLVFFILLAEQIFDAAKQFNTSSLCLVTGHSLGAALAVLASPVLKLVTGNQVIQMYNFAGPRVGNTAFADGYNELVPESFRVVNLADMIPMLPPTKIFGWEYAHVGEEWSFLNQSGNVAGNHALIGSNNYTDAVDRSVPTNAPRVYPVTGLGNNPTS